MSGEDTSKAAFYHDRFLSYAKNLCGNLHSAEDLVQNAYLKLIGYDKPIQDHYAFTITIIRNKFRDVERNRQRSRVVDQQPLPADIAVAVEPQNHKDITQVVMHALSTLPAIYRTVLVDCADGLKYKEIAIMQGIKPGIVGARICRARKMLQERLADCPEANSIPLLLARKSDVA